MAEGSKYRRFVDAEVDIGAPSDVVWSAWTDPELLAGWLPERVTGAVRQGDLVTWHYDSRDWRVVYRIEAAQPGEHLHMAEHASAGQNFGYKVDLSPKGEGTHLCVRGYGVPPGDDHDEMRACARSGLTLSLVRLKHYVELYLGRARNQRFLSRKAAFDYERIAPRFRTAEGLSTWLGEVGADLEVGKPYTLQLRDGDSVTGRVLAAPGHDVMLSWKEVDGAIELRAFPTGRGPRVASVRVTSWPRRRILPGPKLCEQLFERALARLVDQLSQ